MSVKPLHLSPAARADLEALWRFRFENWGQMQADRYLGSLRQVIEGLTTGRSASRPADDARPGYRTVQAGRHLIVFRQTAMAVEVMRVLDQPAEVEGRG